MPAGDKVRSGQPIRVAARTWNRMVDAADWYAEQQRLGGGIGASDIAQSLVTVKVRNDSGADRRRGEVLEITSTGLLDDDQLDAQHLWFCGDLPAVEGRTYGVLRSPIADGDIGPMQLAGVVLALVDIQDTTHRRARLVSGAAVLESAATGGVQIVYKPTGTGEQLCAVLLGAEGAEVQIGKLDGTLSKDSYANATRWQRNSVDTAWEATSPTVTDVVYDYLLGTGETIASGKRVIYSRHSQSGKWLVTAAECP